MPCKNYDIFCIQRHAFSINSGSNTIFYIWLFITENNNKGVIGPKLLTWGLNMMLNTKCQLKGLSHRVSNKKISNFFYHNPECKMDDTQGGANLDPDGIAWSILVEHHNMT